MQSGDGHREFEAARPGGAGVDVDDSLALDTRRLVRVPADDGAEARRGRVEIQLLHVVQDVEVRIGDCGQRERQRPAPLSILPRTATTGASFRSSSRIPGSPTSPAWMISAEPSSARSASGRSRPWVSEIRPMVASAMYR